jgi:hypothetical protein
VDQQGTSNSTSRRIGCRPGAKARRRPGAERTTRDGVRRHGRDDELRSDILIVEDVLDTGRTLQALRDELEARGARSVRICVLLDKPDCRVVDLGVDDVGFADVQGFVAGYGIDLAERYRALPDLVTVLPVRRLGWVSLKKPGERRGGVGDLVGPAGSRSSCAGDAPTDRGSPWIHRGLLCGVPRSA